MPEDETKCRIGDVVAALTCPDYHVSDGEFNGYLAIHAKYGGFEGKSLDFVPDMAPEPLVYTVKNAMKQARIQLATNMMVAVLGSQ